MKIQKNILNTFLLGLGFLLLQSCSSCGIEQQCENMNWFEYGQKVANEGRYLEEDSLVKQCKDVDKVSAQQIDLGFKLGREKMCTYDEITARAKAGKTFFFGFCDNLELRSMKQAYATGLAIFCTRDSGYAFGKSGQIYLNICSRDQEEMFLPEYNRGRKEYLTNEIRINREKLRSDSLLLSSLEKSESSLSANYSHLSLMVKCSQRNIWDEALKKNVNRQVCEEPEYIKLQRDSIHRELEKVHDGVSSTRDGIIQRSTVIENLERELGKLP